ncbi:pilus assembly protein [Aeoliella sp. ICT_H6.2]|uniref:Pilus assembly protein n=1 Tax=Aeoliella straminimaris TaxID=2954799 RepID=A0A9X2JEV4_9BACT|nr:TadE family protein [Aeoliella straminimaris]MCO6042582.1 pilus assembly protein [Aeoliella straminimaris]
MRLFSRKPTDRRRTQGTTIVETAFVLPIFLLFVLSLVEFGHALMVNNVLRSATRAGARMGSTEGRSTSDVEQYVRDILDGAINAELAEVMVKNAQVYDQGSSVPANGQQIEALPDIEVADADPRQLFLVRARVAYNDVALVPMPFMSNVVLQGQAFIRHE